MSQKIIRSWWAEAVFNYSLQVLAPCLAHNLMSLALMKFYLETSLSFVTIIEEP